jgi:hypothetical protein
MTQDRSQTSEQRPIELRLTADELALLRSAVRYLESTLGREEAAELGEVQALSSKLERAERETRGG